MPWRPLVWRQSRHNVSRQRISASLSSHCASHCLSRIAFVHFMVMYVSGPACCFFNVLRMSVWWTKIPEAAGALWKWGSAQSSSAVAQFLVMPRECRTSVCHAVSVCNGQKIQAFGADGLAPFGMCWVWLPLGSVLEFCCAVWSW